MSTVKRDISMSIIADTRRYQAEMAKIPGMTDKAAAKAAQRMVNQEQKRIRDEERLRRRAAKDQEKLAKGTADKTAAAYKAAAATIAAGFAAAATAGAGLLTLGQDVADARNELSDLSVETGISADTLAALRFGANAAGKDLGNLTSGIGQFAKRMAQAERAGGTLAQVFGGLGVELRKTDGTLRETDEVFRQTVQALASVEDGNLRSAAAMELFGKSGGQLVNVTQVLGGDFDLFAGAVEQVGIGMEGGAEEAAEFQRAMAVLSQVMDGIKGSVGGLALSFAQGLAGGIEIAKLAAITGVGGFRVFAAAFELIRSSVSVADGAIPSMEDFARVVDEEGDKIRAELLAEVDAFRALIGSVATAGGEVGDLSGLLDSLTTKQGKNTAATKAAADAEKVAAGVSKDLAKARLDALDPQTRLVVAFNDERRELLALVDAGADAAEVQELIALKGAAMEEQFRKTDAELSKLALKEALVEPLAELEALGPQIEGAFGQLQSELEESRAKAAVLREQMLELVTTGLDTAVGFGELAIDRFGEAATKAGTRADKLRGEIETLRDSMTGASEEERAQIEETIEAKEKELRKARDRRKEANNAARETFKSNKALQIANTIIAGSAAAIRAFAELGPIAGAVAAGAIAADTTLAVAKIKNQKPPKFHMGGMVEPDETPAILRRGEAVLSERATQRLGRRTIEALNRDEPLGSVNVYLGDDLLRSQRLTRAPRGGMHTAIGARSPYLGR
jgi:hypothetical protein